MDFLQVQGDQIVDASGLPVRLRGVCIGGWMNTENFINGYPGTEYGLRSAMRHALGPAKAEFFFDRWLDYFLADEDFAFIRQTGANVVRLALNYRHFERDDAPLQYLESGFDRLCRAVELCARHGLYAILDLHAAQGWQNPDWHSDNAHQLALLWTHSQFEDRVVGLWEELARHYAGNPVVAGYDLLNEPHTRPLTGQQDWTAINRVYRRLVQAIRAIDPKHIIFLEGDNFASGFRGLDAPFADNLVYSGHDYTPAGEGPGPYPGIMHGQYWDREFMREAIEQHQAVQFTRQHSVPLLIGEFGAMYNGAASERPDRLRAVQDQIGIFEQFHAHWTAWTYKDVGTMGWQELDPESDYMQVVAPVLRSKTDLGTDVCTAAPTSMPAQHGIRDLARLIEETICDPNIDPRANQQSLSRVVMKSYAGTLMQPSYAELFKGMSEVELDQVLQSFAFKNCKPHRALLDIVKSYLE